MQRPGLFLVGALVAANAFAASIEEAAESFDAGKWAEAAAAYQAVVDRDPTNAVALGRLARSYAAIGDEAKALAALKDWIATGNASYPAAMGVPEFAALRGDSRFVELVEPLKPCNTPEFRQFDFWIGEWNVESIAAPGKISRNRITRINGGCTLLEEYATPIGYEGTSLNFYDAARKVWHQTWIDNQGGALFLEGGLQGDEMVMATTTDARAISRITWTPLEDGRVRQHWQSTADGGKTWATVFDGYYSKRQGE